MGYRHTVEISRHDAIERITLIRSLIKSKDFLQLESVSNEPDEPVADFVMSSVCGDEDLQKFTNGMLSELMDMPYFRKSHFENYLVIS